MTKEQYESLPLTELKEIAKARGLKGTSIMKKADLIQLMLDKDVEQKPRKIPEKAPDTVPDPDPNPGSDRNSPGCFHASPDPPPARPPDPG